MMVFSNERQQRSWNPPPDETLKDASMPSSSSPSIHGEVVSPLSPLSPQHLFSTDGGNNTASLSREGGFSSILHATSPLDVESPPWMECCWSDATTASAVLSLLHKDPMGPPSNMSERESTRCAPYITCSVCFEPLDPSLYPRTSIAADCDHTSMPGTYICTICLSRSLDTQISNSQTALLTCPLCHTILSDEEVERWASRPTFQVYDMARTWRILEDDVDFVKCINPDCGYGQLHTGGPGDPVVICANCGVRTCYTHRNIPWHEGVSCAEFEIMDQSSMVSENLMPGLPTELGLHGPRRGQLASEELLSQRTIQATTRACPSCHAATEKAGGCKYMRCKCSPNALLSLHSSAECRWIGGVCWHDWCWDCGIFWERGHLGVDCSFALYAR
ncbi:hypothetical protein BJX63DRAFT_334751 [Aspergillus granulosus]|uniref:RBR-type E3 ubiquitin transferase n=1 Tax=Aspergillus granulosus TaxID=176169 RepID=A0ABR4HY28_9EURO